MAEVNGDRGVPRTIGVFSGRLSRIPHLASFLGAGKVVHVRAPWVAAEWRCGTLDGVAGWGYKPTADRARAFARERGLPYIAVEDGFLRSLDLASAMAPPLSLIVDGRGIYYDASRPSWLEGLLNDPSAITAVDVRRANDAMATIRRLKLSKYNHGTDRMAVPGRPGRRILVADQTRDDMSVLLGRGSDASFRCMVQDACRENPEADILVKLHPETVAGRKRGYLSEMKLPPGVVVVAEAVNPIALLEDCEKLYTVSSQLGFEALCLGLPVVCYGLPFYAGWGCTKDRQILPRRKCKRSPDEIFAAAYLHYARYVDPVTGYVTGIERAIELLAEAKRLNEANRGTTICLGMQLWKRRHLRPFLASTGGRAIFARNGRQALARGAKAGDRILIWGQRQPKDTAMLARLLGGAVGHVEDGFLRSVGLGSDFVRPSSLVVDWQGSHYDPSRPSDLETLLATADFDADLTARGTALRKRIVAAGLSKYNVGRKPLVRPAGAEGRRILLVAGQVEDDASIRLGCGEVCSNIALLRAVRHANPDAWIVYKPHPDVVARNRRGGAGVAAAEFADAVWSGVNISDCLALADELHVMTSLAGFEGLLRGKPVVTYGGPFYAGWGLTGDRMEFPRRNRRLALDQLVAGALILYPRYYDWKSGTVCDCEAIVSALASGGNTARLPADASPFRSPDRLVRRLGRLIWETVNA